MSHVGTTEPKPLDPPALRGFKTFLAAALGTVAVTAIGLGAAKAIGQDPGLGPSAVMGFVAVVHFAHERLMGILVGRGRLGAPDGLARRLATEARSVARREPDGAWVVLSHGGKAVQVLDRKGFEELAAVCARAGEVMKVIRNEGDRYVVDRYEGGILRDADGPEAGGSAVEVFDRRGSLIATRSVAAPAPPVEIPGPTIRVADDGTLALISWRRGLSHVEVTGRRLPDYVKPGTDLRRAVDEALTRGPVHARKGMSWLAYEAADEEPRVIPDRAYQRLRRTNRDHVEVAPVWDGVQLGRLTCGRLDSAAHGCPSLLSFDADGHGTGEEWYVDGRLGSEDEAVEAHASYRAQPMAGMA